MCSFHKQDKIFASDLYGRLQWLAYRLAIVNAQTDLLLIFYLLHKNYEQVTWLHQVASFTWAMLMIPYLPIFPWNFFGLDENHNIVLILFKGNFVTFLVLVGLGFR